VKIKLTKLDILFSRYIRLKADNHCEYCGEYKKRLQTSHFHGRRKRVVRWDEDNVAALCFSCHLYLGENPQTHTEWFIQRLGSERFERLNIRANQVIYTSTYKQDIEALTAKYKGKIKELEEMENESMATG